MENNETILREDNLVYPIIASQEVGVCLPITVKPYAKIGLIKTKCCGPAVIRPGSKCCDGVKNGECAFTVTQKLRVNIPIICGAKAITGDNYVCCLEPCAELCDALEAVEYDEYGDSEEYEEEGETE